MADQWKAKVISLAGAPLILLDVTITRTIPIDAPNLERIRSILADAGQQQSIVEFLNLVETLPQSAWRYIAAPWTKADYDEFNLRPLADIFRLFDTSAYWRIEGSAATGFTGVLNVGCIERRFEITKATIPELQAKLVSIKDATQAEVDAGNMTQQQKDFIDKFCEGADKNLVACGEILDAFAKAQAERDRQERERQEREARDRERKETGEGTYTGDFPDGWGADFGDTA
jgi:hypothetical protein